MENWRKLLFNHHQIPSLYVPLSTSFTLTFDCNNVCISLSGSETFSRRNLWILAFVVKTCSTSKSEIQYEILTWNNDKWYKNNQQYHICTDKNWIISITKSTNILNSCTFPANKIALWRPAGLFHMAGNVIRGSQTLCKENHYDNIWPWLTTSEKCKQTGICSRFLKFLTLLQLDFQNSGNVVMNNFHFYTRQNRYGHGKTCGWFLI